MRGYERVDDHQADLVGADRVDDRLDRSVIHARAGARLNGDDDLAVAPTVDEKAAFQFGRVDIVVDRSRDDATLQFLQWVFAIPDPNVALFVRFDSQQGATRRDRERLGEAQRRLS